MTIPELLAELNARGITLAADGNELIVRGEAQKLDESLQSLLRAEKQNLLKLLHAQAERDSISLLTQLQVFPQLSPAEIDRIVSGVPGGVDNLQDVYPLVSLQEGMLFHYLMGAHGDPHLMVLLGSFDTRAQLDRYLGATQAVINRHDILRTAVAWEGLPEPMQVVWRKAELPVEEVKLDPAQGDIAEQLRIRFDSQRYRIDIRQAPLLRAFIAYDANRDRWLLLQLVHHLVGDQTTREVINEEICAHLEGREHELPKPLPFRNFVAQARTSAKWEGHDEFFRGLLGDVEEPTAPFGLQDARGDGRGVEEARHEIDGGLARRLRERARKLGVSVASICHLAWALVLARVSGREDVVFGTVLFGRMQGSEGADRALGLFINTLPVRIRITDREVEASVRQTHGLLGELLRHEYASLAQVQRCSRVPAPAPLFSALLNYRHAAGRSKSSSAARMLEGLGKFRSEETTNYPLVLTIVDSSQELLLVVGARMPIDAKRVCALMHTALERLVEALETAPAGALRSIDVLPDEERHQILHEWNAAKLEYSPEKCIHELFEEQVGKTPATRAVVYEETFLTYEELNIRANRLAHYLRLLGVKPDTRVAICVEPGLEMLVGVMGVLKAGGAYVPLDPAYPEERLRFMVGDCEPAVVLTQKNLAGLFQQESARLPVLDLSAEVPVWQEQPERNPGVAEVGLQPSHLAYIIYTSGSTGTPKGVMVEHANVVRLFAATDPWFRFNHGDVWTLFHSFAFDFSVWEMFGALLYGGRLVVTPREIVRSPQDFYTLLCREHVTILNQTPGAFRQLIAAQAEGAAAHQLRCLIFGGEALDVASLKPWYQRNGGRTRLVNMYGITETTVHVTYRELEEADTARVGPSPIGSCIPDLRIYILDSMKRPVPVGVAGELYVAGSGVARGYLNRPELTLERFVKDPFIKSGQGRMYKTGDLGRWLPDGTIEYMGRNDEQIKVRGYRIELGEIGVQLAEHPFVREAVVITREDQPGERRLVGYYTCNQEVGADSLRAHLAARLPEYMVPAVYVRLEALPLTANGKLDRKALPTPEMDAYAVRGYVEPEGEIETSVAGIWGEVLQVERVGRYDNFFDLGGHSLSATRVVSLVRDLFQVKIGLRVLFENPTVAAIAKEIEALGVANQIDVFNIAGIINQISNLPEDEAKAKLVAKEG